MYEQRIVGGGVQARGVRSGPVRGHCRRVQLWQGGQELAVRPHQERVRGQELVCGHWDCGQQTSRRTGQICKLFSKKFQKIYFEGFVDLKLLSKNIFLVCYILLCS